MNLTTASRTFQLLTRLLDTRSRTEPFLPPNGEKKPLPLRLPPAALSPGHAGVPGRLLGPHPPNSWRNWPGGRTCTCRMF